MNQPLITVGLTGTPDGEKHVAIIVGENGNSVGVGLGVDEALTIAETILAMVETIQNAKFKAQMNLPDQSGYEQDEDEDEDEFCGCDPADEFCNCCSDDEEEDDEEEDDPEWIAGFTAGYQLAKSQDRK